MIFYLNTGKYHMSLSIKPDTLALTGSSVSAEIIRDATDGSFAVTIFVVHKTDGSRVLGKDIKARLQDINGNELKLLDYPEGVLPETGGSLGMSAHGIFRFKGEKVLPSLLFITYQGQQARFAIDQE
ncbi:hypothetical protein ASB62_06100 [Chlorobium limicola]|uniref:DUF4352 domain-containing protein n=2 Tax=Chlorobium limicola TaxID=1092 RepID=A0A101JIZ2_CHLLI|nr:hypothetical protein ASB62_06100 [Chlorobium limicola]